MIRLIGVRWKCSNAWSQDVLIGRISCKERCSSILFQKLTNCFVEFEEKCSLGVKPHSHFSSNLPRTSFNLWKIMKWMTDRNMWIQSCTVLWVIVLNVEFVSPESGSESFRWRAVEAGTRAFCLRKPQGELVVLIWFSLCTTISRPMAGHNNVPPQWMPVHFQGLQTK